MVSIPGPHSDPLPARDADFAAFASQFAAGWVPATFNVVLPSSVSLIAAAGAFEVALNLVRDPATTTTPAIAAKDALRASLSASLRGAIRSAQAAFLAGTASEQSLLDLGVRPNSVVRTPISGPQFAPQMALDAVGIGVTDLRITQIDQETGLAVSTRRYPYGIVGAEVQRKIGVADWESLGVRRVVRINDSYSGFTAGTALLYRARYMTARGLLSPFCPDVASAILV